jgi:nucleotidyltransferase substrate binding protein (TIGR01987 family)
MKLSLTPPANAKLGFNDIMREAARYGLIDDPKSWIEYRRARNITSLTYNEIFAQEVYEIAIKFSTDAKKLLTILNEKNV